MEIFGSARGGADCFCGEAIILKTLQKMEGIFMPMPALLASRHGGLWVGTIEGLLRYEAAGTKSWFARDGISAKRDVRCVIESRAGAVWFGTAGEGLFCLEAGKLKQFRKADGLADNFVRCLREDETGAIWIGTSDGLVRFKDNHFAAISTKQGLFDKVICDIEDDGHGSFWISSFNGIFRVSQTELQQCADGRTASIQCLAFGISDGLPTLEATSGGCKTADGKLWFPTSRGLVAIDPANARTNKLPPPVLIEGLLVDNQLVAGQSSLSGLKISPGRHRFEFQYTGLSFAAPEKVRFKHRLDKLDADWIDAGPKRTADFPYLPPGGYTFHVIACNNEWCVERNRYLPHVHRVAVFLADDLVRHLLVAALRGHFTHRCRRDCLVWHAPQDASAPQTGIARTPANYLCGTNADRQRYP